jgi:glycosyltransferase involved in cell wall biosynthesis
VPPDKVQRIFNAYHGPAAADVRETPAEARARLGLPEGPRYLLTVCRLMNWKRVDGILRALAELPGDVHLLVAGDGDMQAEWQRLAVELAVAERTRFLGNVPHSEIAYLVRAAEIFVLNSEYEGLSHTLLEVQALGTPIVASGVCGNPEVVEDGVNGLLVDPRDHASLRRALETLLGDRSIQRRFVAAGLERSADFTREGTFSAVEAALLRAAGN